MAFAYDSLSIINVVYLSSLNGNPYICNEMISDNVHHFVHTHTHTDIHNRFTALQEYVRDHPDKQVPER